MSTPLPDLTPADAATMLADSEVMLLDVREDDEWVAGHARGAIHTPLGQLDPATHRSDRQIIVVCRSGNRSGKAAALLAAADLPVHNLAGGMKAWESAGHDVICDDGSPGTVI